MAFTKAASRSTALAPRRAAGVSKARFEAVSERAKNIGKRLREVSKDDDDAMVSVATGIALAVIESKTKLPTIGGVDPLLLGGGIGYFLTRKKRGKTTEMIRQASIASLTIGANRSTTRGGIRVGEDDTDDL